MTGMRRSKPPSARIPMSSCSTSACPGSTASRSVAALRLQGHEKAVIVAITGYGQAEDRRRSRAAGFDAHLVKPVNPDELVKLVEGTARARRGDPG